MLLARNRLVKRAFVVAGTNNLFTIGAIKVCRFSVGTSVGRKNCHRDAHVTTVYKMTNLALNSVKGSVVV
jgi:hypothetical protein